MYNFLHIFQSQRKKTISHRHKERQAEAANMTENLPGESFSSFAIVSARYQLVFWE